MSLLLIVLQKYMHSTMPKKDNENYRMNAGASPKYETAYKPTFKHGYHNKQNNQGRFVHRELANDSRHNNQKIHNNYDNQNYDRTANIGIIRGVNDRRHDDQRRYDENHDNPNRDRIANIGIIRVVNDDQRRYDNHDNHHQNKYANARMNQTANGGRYDNHRRYDNYENRNRYDTQSRRGNQNRRENYNRYDQQGRWEDVQDRRSISSRQNNASRPEPVQRRNWEAISAHTWRVVCDSMLGGLSGKLRMCGIDCVHVLFDQGGDDSARLAMRENRILLTRNKSYERVRFALYVLTYVYQYRSYFNNLCYVSLSSICRWRIAIG